MFSSFNYSSFKYIILVKVAQNLLSLYFTDIETWRKKIDVEPFESYLSVCCYINFFLKKILSLVTQDIILN